VRKVGIVINQDCVPICPRIFQLINERWKQLINSKVFEGDIVGPVHIAWPRTGELALQL
jgi:hypothetical protein